MKLWRSQKAFISTSDFDTNLGLKWFGFELVGDSEKKKKKKKKKKIVKIIFGRNMAIFKVLKHFWIKKKIELFSVSFTL